MTGRKAFVKPTYFDLTVTDLQPESLARVVAVPAPGARVEILELVR